MSLIPGPDPEKLTTHGRTLTHPGPSWTHPQSERGWKITKLCWECVVLTGIQPYLSIDRKNLVSAPCLTAPLHISLCTASQPTNTRAIGKRGNKDVRYSGPSGIFGSHTCVVYDFNASPPYTTVLILKPIFR